MLSRLSPVAPLGGRPVTAGTLSSAPLMPVRDLLSGFAASGWSTALDLGSLPPLPASYVSHDLDSVTATWCGASASGMSDGCTRAAGVPVRGRPVDGEGRVGDADLPSGNLVSALIALETNRDRARATSVAGDVDRSAAEKDDEDLTAAFTEWVVQVLLPRRFGGSVTGPLPRIEEVRAMWAETVQEWNRGVGGAGA